MAEKFDFNIEKLESVLEKGDYYSKDLKHKKIFVLRKKEIDEIKQCFEFSSEDSNFGIDEEERESGILFVIGIMRDIIENKKYKIIEGILKEDSQSEVKG